MYACARTKPTLENKKLSDHPHCVRCSWVQSSAGVVAATIHRVEKHTPALVTRSRWCVATDCAHTHTERYTPEHGSAHGDSCMEPASIADLPVLVQQVGLCSPSGAARQLAQCMCIQRLTSATCTPVLSKRSRSLASLRRVMRPPVVKPHQRCPASKPTTSACGLWPARSSGSWQVRRHECTSSLPCTCAGGVRVCVCVHACPACVRACARACVRVCVCACACEPTARGVRLPRTANVCRRRQRTRRCSQRLPDAAQPGGRRSARHSS
jgi:hypothetical protein